METLALLGASIAFFAVGLSLVLYELARTKAGRPILKGGIAAQSYYIIYLAMLFSRPSLRSKQSLDSEGPS